VEYSSLKAIKARSHGEKHNGRPPRYGEEKHYGETMEQ
jgi:hypothetical protein